MTLEFAQGKARVYPAAVSCTFPRCGRPFTPTNRRQRFCSARCRSAARHLPMKLEAQERRNARLRARNRDRSLGFDGRYGGPVNLG